MSQVNNKLINPNDYTLQQFKDLARTSGDDAELRVRKSNLELTNTPLGFIARNFGKDHARSNIIANKLFMRTLASDNRYRCIARQLVETLAPSMPQTAALTPAKVRQAVATAEIMLTARQEGKTIAGMLTDNKILPGSMQGEFVSFFAGYKGAHPDVRLDLRDFGDTTQLTAEQRNLGDYQKQAALRQADDNRLKPLKDVLVAFFSAGDRLERMNVVRFLPEDCGSDAAKAKALTDLFARNDKDLESLSTEQTRRALLGRAFVTGYPKNLPASGNILSFWENAIHNRYMDSTNSVLHGNNVFLHLDAADIEHINRSIPSGFSPDKRLSCLQAMHGGINAFLRAHPNAKEPGHGQELSRLVDHLCGVLQRQGAAFTAGEANAAALDFAVLRQLDDAGMDEVFRQAGMDADFGRAVLRGEDFRKAVLPAVTDLGSNRTEADIQRVVREQARNFLQQNAAVLRNLQTANAGMNPRHPEALAALGLAFSGLLQKMGDSAASEVDLLQKVNVLAERFLSPQLDDAARGRLLNIIADTLFGPLGTDDKTALCRDNRARFGQLLGQLQSVMARKGDYTPAVRQSCSKTALVLNSIYGALLQRVPEEHRAELALTAPPQAADNPKLARQAERPGGQPVQPIQRNATPAEVFAAIQELKNTNMPQIYVDRIGPLMEALHCTDSQLINDVYGTTNQIINMLKSLHTTSDHASNMKEYIRQLFDIGKYINEMAAQYPQFSARDMMQFCMDLFIATHSEEQLAKVLDGLYSPESELVLAAIANHATKETVALGGAATTPNLENVSQTFAALPYLADKIAARLGREKPGPLPTESTGITLRDLPKQNAEIVDQFHSMFPGHLNLFDEKMFMIKGNMDNARYERLKDFYGKLRLPAGKNQPETAGKAKLENYFYAKIKDGDGETEDMWNVEHLAVMFAFHAEELDALLEASGGRPTPAALWELLHGGEAPRGLSMDNFVEKLMQRTAEELYAYGKMVDESFEIDGFINICYAVTGIPPKTLLQKFSQVAHQDVTITMQDQQLLGGVFSDLDGKQFENGNDAYGFGFDFTRAKMPPGSDKKTDEGCRITVVAGGEEKVFTQKAYWEFTKNESAKGLKYVEGSLEHPYMQQIVNAVRPMCKNDAQLAGVGKCTTQALQMALRNAKTFYKDVSGGAFEHTALDHRIEPQEDGTVKVTVTEKPGTLFKFHMEFAVDTAGVATMNKAEITYPSYDKWQAYKEAHPEENLM